MRKSRKTREGRGRRGSYREGPIGIAHPAMKLTCARSDRSSAGVCIPSWNDLNCRARRRRSHPLARI